MGRRIVALLTASLLASGLSACFPAVVAGSATGAFVANDRRATQTVYSDKEIDSRLSDEYVARFGETAHITTTVFNRAVLLTGEVPSEAAKADAEKRARNQANVRNVFNELVVEEPSGFGARSNDAALTTRVKARMIDANLFSPLHVRVVSERGTVFLMGLVKQREAQDAARIASETGGVRQVVTLFEYID